MQKGLIVHNLVVNEKGEVLLLQRSSKNDVLPGYWDIPGGTLEDGEDPAIGAARETKEEAGIETDWLQLFFHHSNVDTQKNKQFVTLIFTSRYVGGDIVLSPEEHDAYRWVNPSKLASYQVVAYLPDCVRAYVRLKTNPIN